MIKLSGIRVFTLSFNHHQAPFHNVFIIQTETLSPWDNNYPCCLPPRPLVTSILFFISVTWWCQVPQTSRIIEHLSFCVWLISLGVMSARLFRVVGGTCQNFIPFSSHLGRIWAPSSVVLSVFASLREASFLFTAGWHSIAHVLHFVYPFTLTFGLFVSFDVYECCPCEWRCASPLFPLDFS